jgi:hypothetical protein
MRGRFTAINSAPDAEERPGARLEARTVSMDLIVLQQRFCREFGRK